MTITAYVMNIDSTQWRLENIDDEIVCGPAYESAQAQEAAQEAAQEGREPCKSE